MITGAPATGLAAIRDHYLEPPHVREIVNRAPFFVQQHGHTLNAAFTVYPSWRARSSEANAVAAIKKFREELTAKFGLANAPFKSRDL